jgi:hypothetical protein
VFERDVLSRVDNPNESPFDPRDILGNDADNYGEKK